MAGKVTMTADRMLDGYRRQARFAVKQATGKLLSEAQARVPVKTGALKGTLREEMLDEGNIIRGFVRAGDERVNYARLQDQGFPHWRSGKQVAGKHYLSGPLEEMSGEWTSGRLFRGAARAIRR